MRPQLREGDDAFVAVERYNANGWCRICRGGQEKVMRGSSFPPTVGDVDVKGLEDQKFRSSVWRGGDCGGGAGGVCCRGGDGGGGDSCARACVTLLLLQLKCTAL